MYIFIKYTKLYITTNDHYISNKCFIYNRSNLTTKSQPWVLVLTKTLVNLKAYNVECGCVTKTNANIRKDCKETNVCHPKCKAESREGRTGNHFTNDTPKAQSKRYITPIWAAEAANPVIDTCYRWMCIL